MHNIHYLRVIVTNNCNLKCFFCHHEGIKSETYNLNLNQLMGCIDILLRCGIMKVKFIGGEPTTCAGLDQLIKKIKDTNKNIDVSLITNGIVSQKTLDILIESCIDRINVSLHGFELGIFKNVTGGTEQQFNKVFETIEYLSDKRVLGKINYVLLKGINEEEFFKVLEYIHHNNYVLDVLNYLDYDLTKLKLYHYDFSTIEAMIRKIYMISDVRNYDNKYSIPSVRINLVGGGTINMKVNKLNQRPFLKGCDNCNKKELCNEGIAAIRLTNAGIIKPCIFREDNCFDLIGYMRHNTFEQSVTSVQSYLNAL